jgi:hypothetical protein
MNNNIKKTQASQRQHKHLPKKVKTEQGRRGGK